MQNQVCVVAIPPSIPEGRKIDQLGVFAITAFFSVFAYVWVLIVLVYSSPDVIETWEAGKPCMTIVNTHLYTHCDVCAGSKAPCCS